MTEREKIDAAVDYLLDRGASVHSAAPVHYRIAWGLGWCVRPPHFQSIIALFLFNSAFLVVSITPVVLLAERRSPVPVLVQVMLPYCGALGLVVAVIYRVKAWWLGLPRWTDFLPESVQEAGEDDEGW